MRKYMGEQEKTDSIKSALLKVVGYLILTNILPVLGIIIKLIASDGYKYTCLQAYIAGIIVEASAFILFFLYIFSMSLIENH